VSSNHVGNDGVRALAESEHMTNLKSLELRDNNVSSRGLETLTSSPNFGSVVALGLYNNAIGDQGAYALADSPFATNLEHLILDRSIGIEEQGIAALASSTNLPMLKALSLETPRGHSPLNLGHLPHLIHLESLGRGIRALGHIGWPAYGLEPSSHDEQQRNLRARGPRQES